MSDDEVAEAELVDEHGEASASTTAALVPVNAMPANALTAPIATIEQVRTAFAAYQELRGAVITAEDQQSIGDKMFVKKSGWRKMATVMGVSAEERSRAYQRDPQGRIIEAEVMVRAIAPNGRFMEGLGVCDYRERCCPRAYADDAVCKNSSRYHTHCTTDCDGFNHFSKPQHDLPATAYTRALNRACSDLFGFGEVSAEEVTDKEEPLEAETIAKYVAGMNAIEDERTRTLTKQSFARMFGMPDELKKGQVAAVERYLHAQKIDFSGAPAAAAPAQTTAASDAPDDPTGPREGEPAARETRAESAPEGGEAGALSEAVTPPASPPPSTPGDAKPSTPQQRQTLGMLWRDLADKGLALEGDKAEICGVITQDRTTTTLEITFDEAVMFISGTRLIQQGVIEIVDDPNGGGHRSLVSNVTPGKNFLRKLPGGVVPQDA